MVADYFPTSEDLFAKLTLQVKSVGLAFLSGWFLLQQKFAAEGGASPQWLKCNGMQGNVVPHL